VIGHVHCVALEYCDDFKDALCSVWQRMLYSFCIRYAFMIRISAVENVVLVHIAHQLQLGMVPSRVAQLASA